MTFFEYMMRYIEKDSPSGDLAKDMRRDKEHFPDSSDRDEIAGYLFSRGACSECLQIFRTCYKRYELYEQKHNRKS